MRSLRADGLATRAIADAVNDEGLTTRKGGRWSSASVARLLRRAA
ncbi:MULTISPECIES: recombinase family protein [Rhodococcus]